MRWSRAGASACLCIALPALLAATEPEGHTLRRIELPGDGTLVLSTPSAWRASATRPSRDFPPTLEFTPPSGNTFSVKVTVMSPLKPEPLELSNVKKTVKASRARAAESAETQEQEIEIRELQGENNVSGYYFSAVDKYPKPGEWCYMTHGLAVLKDLLLSFTVLSNDPAQPEAAETLKMLQGATRVAEPTAAKSTHMEIAIPNETWSISFDAPALSDVKQSEESGDFQFSGNSHLFNLSFFVEKPRGKGTTHLDCRDFYWAKARKNPRIEKKSIAFSETDKYARVQYDIVVRQPALRQTNVNYYFIYGGKWVDIHISFVNATAEDEQIFKTFDSTLSYGPSTSLEKPPT